MSHRKHGRQDVKGSKNDYFEPETTANNKLQRKKSLGALRKNEKTKPRSPDATGKLYFQRDTLTEIYRQLADSGDDEVICNLAGGETTISMGHILPWRSRRYSYHMSGNGHGMSHSMICSMRKKSSTPA